MGAGIQILVFMIVEEVLLIIDPSLVLGLILFLNFFIFYLFIFNFLFILCTLVFCLHVCLCKGVQSHGTGATDSCKLPCGCWDLNPGPLEEQPVLLTTEPSLQLQKELF